MVISVHQLPQDLIRVPAFCDCIVKAFRLFFKTTATIRHTVLLQGSVSLAAVESYNSYNRNSKSLDPLLIQALRRDFQVHVL